MAQVPRGVRNNNPLNIRIGNTWVGEVLLPTDPAFEQFTDMVWGLRAGFLILRRYITHYKRRTVRQIVSSWAPESENLTEKYIQTVSARMAFPADSPLDMHCKPQLCDMVQAMVFVECGQEVDRDVIERAYDMVFKR